MGGGGSMVPTFGQPTVLGVTIRLGVFENGGGVV